MKSRAAGHPSKLTRVADILRRQGLPLTIQRRTIYEALEGRLDHPTADQVYEGVRHRIPGLSRTTVYRVLETLVRVGAARKIGHPGAAARFDPRVDHHHHLVCVECERLIDFELSSEDRIPVPSSRKTGFRVLDYSIHFTGLCFDCRQSTRTAAGTRKRR